MWKQVAYTNSGDEASMVMQWTVNPPLYSTTGSIPVISTKHINSNMIIATPLDIPPLVPDDWNVFWEIWHKNADNLVKTYFVPQNPVSRPVPNNSMLGRNDIWFGMDIFQTASSERRTLWQSPYVDISHSLPKLYQQCINLPFSNVRTIRIVKSLKNFSPHADDGLDIWRIRAMLYHPWEEQQWHFSLPDGNKTIPLSLPKETNWFSYNDKHCWHGTTYNPDREKLLVIVDGLVQKSLIEKSIEKYKDFTVTSDSFL